MKKQYDLLVQANALHDAVLEQYPAIIRNLLVVSTKSQVVWQIDDPPAGLEELLDKIPFLVLSPDKTMIACDGIDKAIVTVYGRGTSITLQSYLVGDKSNASPVVITLTNGVGTFDVQAMMPGRIIVEKIDDMTLARVRINATVEGDIQWVLK